MCVCEICDIFLTFEAVDGTMWLDLYVATWLDERLNFQIWFLRLLLVNNNIHTGDKQEKSMTSRKNSNIISLIVEIAPKRWKKFINPSKLSILDKMGQKFFRNSYYQTHKLIYNEQTKIQAKKSSFYKNF